MKLTQEQKDTINALEDAINDANCIGCRSVGGDCSKCLFRYDADDGAGYSCTIGQMDNLLDYIRENIGYYD